MTRLRQWMAAMLIVVGVTVVVRSVHHAITRNLGLQGIVIAFALGAMLFALGIARWRYWQNEVN